MGLDMYAYVAAKAGQYREYYETGDYDPDTQEFANLHIEQPRELAYWRKHPNLHGWMERLAKEKGLNYTTFNGVELELTWHDIERLEQTILSKELPSTQGFFFGDDADAYYQHQDLEFCRQAKSEIFLGLKVFYNSSW
jgi:hypothetical protein